MIDGYSTATSCWVASSERIRSIPTCCSGANTSVPAKGPEVTLHGSDPINVGVTTISLPSTKQLTFRWWPSSCHPPGFIDRRSAEDRHEVRPLAVLVGTTGQGDEQPVESHDVARLRESAGRESRSQQLQAKLALLRRQAVEHHAVAE